MMFGYTPKYLFTVDPIDGVSGEIISMTAPWIRGGLRD